MKKYEAVYILDEQKVDDQGEVFVKSLQGVIESLGGNVEYTNAMGRRQFAAPIKKKNTGLYWNLEFNLPEAQLLTLQNHYRLDGTVLRNAIFIFDRPAVTVINRKKDGDSSDIGPEMEPDDE